MAKVNVTWDLECDNLLPLTSTIHVGVFKIIGKPIGEDASYRVIRTKEQLQKVIPYLGDVVFHNGLGFDLFVTSRIWNIPFHLSANGKEDTWDGHPVRFVDTFHLSMWLNPDRIGGHSGEAWGERVGVPKPKHEDWSMYSEEMLHRCRRDTDCTELTYLKLLEEWEKRSG